MSDPFQLALKKSSLAAILNLAIDLIWLMQAGLIAWFFHWLAVESLVLKSVIIFILSFAILALLRTYLSYISALKLNKIADKLIAQIRLDLIAQQDQISPYASNQNSSAMITSLFIDKLELLRPYILRYRSAYFRAGFITVIIILISATLSWVAALIFIITGPMIPVFMALIGMAAKSASERQLREIGNMNEIILERLQALADIRVLGAREAMLAQFKNTAERLRQDTMAVLKIAFLSSTILELFSAIGIAMMAVYVGFSLLGEINFGAYESGISIGEGVFLLLLSPAFFQPLRDIAAAWHDKVAAIAVWNEVQNIRASSGPSMLPNDHEVHQIPIHISGRGIVIQNGDKVLSYPDFRLKSGEKLAICGSSGAGKSTFLALIGGLITPTQGKIIFGQSDLLSVPRAQISWLPQRPHFFQTHLRDYITAGLGQISDRDIKTALERACIAHLLDQLPEGLDTIIGENGGGISGGEARRLMIARAALEARPVILADEPTADLDDHAADKVITLLNKLNANGASLIVATHDPRLLSHFPNQITLGAS